MNLDKNAHQITSAYRLYISCTIDTRQKWSISWPFIKRSQSWLTESYATVRWPFPLDKVHRALRKCWSLLSHPTDLSWSSQKKKKEPLSGSKSVSIFVNSFLVSISARERATFTFHFSFIKSGKPRGVVALWSKFSHPALYPLKLVARFAKSILRLWGAVCHVDLEDAVYRINFFGSRSVKLDLPPQTLPERNLTRYALLFRHS